MNNVANNLCVNIEIVDYFSDKRTGYVHLFVFVEGERDERGRRPREIYQAKSAKIAVQGIGNSSGLLADINSGRIPSPTHVHGVPIKGDLLEAIMAQRVNWL